MMKRKPMHDLATDENTDEFRRNVFELTEAFVEDLEEEMLEDLEPYEVYASHVRHHVYNNIAQFHDRFAKGYQVLLREIKEIQSEEES